MVLEGEEGRGEGGARGRGREGGMERRERERGSKGGREGGKEGGMKRREREKSEGGKEQEIERGGNMYMYMLYACRKTRESTCTRTHTAHVLVHVLVHVHVHVHVHGVHCMWEDKRRYQTIIHV